MYGIDHQIGNSENLMSESEGVSEGGNFSKQIRSKYISKDQMDDNRSPDIIRINDITVMPPHVLKAPYYRDHRSKEVSKTTN